MKNPLCLASASPRRQQLLQQMGLRFVVEVAGIEEHLQGDEPEPALALACQKAEAVARRFPQRWVLGADTMVAIGGQLLGKPETENQALCMLRMLSGAWHQVHTGLCLMHRASGRQLARLETTRVHMVPVGEAELLRYVRTGEPMDKAGAYGIQGRAGMFIDRIEGSYENVMGLSTCALREMLQSLSLLADFL